MKRWLILALLLCAMNLGGCKRQPQIAICVRQMDAGLTKYQAAQLEKVLQNAGYRVKTVDAHNDQSLQNTQIRQLLREKVDLLVVEPVITAQMPQIAEETTRMDRPLIFLNYEMDEKFPVEGSRLCSIATQSSQAAAVQWQVFSRLPDGADQNGDGRLGYCRIGVDQRYLRYGTWEEGCKKSFREPALGVQWGQWNVESGRRIAARQLDGFSGQLDVIFCGCDDLTLGARESLEGNACCLIGMGGDETILRLIRQGEITATVCPDIFAIADTAASLAGALLQGERVEKCILLPPVAVTKENVDKFLQ